MDQKTINEACNNALASLSIPSLTPKSPTAKSSSVLTTCSRPSNNSVLEPIIENVGLSKSSLVDPDLNSFRETEYTRAGKVRMKVRYIYEQNWIQTLVIVIICINGLLYIVQATNWNRYCCINNVEATRLINEIDDWLLYFYTLELCVNFYAHFFYKFWESRWNKFDVVVIGASWIPMDSNVAAIRMSRLLRTLRLVRIGGRVEAFKVIIVTLQNSLNGVWTLMFLLAGLMTIYAILGVALFGEDSGYFRDFINAIWTLFVTVNGENWPDIMKDIQEDHWYTTLYFGSFIVIAGMIIMNMIVAVFILQMGKAMRDRGKRVSVRGDKPLVLHQGKFMSNTDKERMLMKLVRRKTSTKKLEVIRKQFDKINVKKEEEFGIEELVTFMETVSESKEVARKKSQEIMDHIDQNGDERISKEEWEDAQSLALFRNSFRGRVRKFIEAVTTQKIVSALIVLNGVLYIIETGNWTPDCCVRNKEVKEIISKIDYGFLIVFSIELSLNFFSHSQEEFWWSPWNVFDVVVIGVSWIPMHSNMTAVRLSRLVRTLRLLRVGGRVGPILIVISTLYRSLAEIGALVGLLVGLIVIFGVLGVGLFGEHSSKFETFPVAVWTLFVTLNGETWPIFAEELMMLDCWYAGPYFAIFIVVAVAICMNMIIAVFIDKTDARIKVKRQQTMMPVNLAKSLSNVNSSDIRRLMTDREKSPSRSTSAGRTPGSWPSHGGQPHGIFKMLLNLKLDSSHATSSELTRGVDFSGGGDGDDSEEDSYISDDDHEEDIKLDSFEYSDAIQDNGGSGRVPNPEVSEDSGVDIRNANEVLIKSSPV